MIMDISYVEQNQHEDVDEQNQESMSSINIIPQIILSRNNSRSKQPDLNSNILINMEEGKNDQVSSPSDDSNYYNYDSEDENLLHIFDDVRINPKAKDIPHYTYKKIDFKDVEYKINKSYAEINNKYSSALDVLASYLKGHKVIYMESKFYCETYLNIYMMPAILFSTAATVLSPFLKTYPLGAMFIAGLNGVIAFLLAIVNYLKLDAASEAHKISAHQYDKLQSTVEFTSGSVLLFRYNDLYKKEYETELLEKKLEKEKNCENKKNKYEDEIIKKKEEIEDAKKSMEDELKSKLDEVEKSEVSLGANLVIDYEADSVDVVAMLLYLEDMFKNASQTTRTVVPTDKLGQIVLVEDIFDIIYEVLVGIESKMDPFVAIKPDFDALEKRQKMGELYPKN